MSQAKQIKKWVSEFDLESFVLFLQDKGVEVDCNTVVEKEEISEYLQDFFDSKEDLIDIFNSD